MSVPKPAVPLDGACTAIHDNTLFAYSSKGFQSISLEVGAEWQTLAMGEAVDGGVCVEADSKDASQAGFYVVGGGRVGGDPFAGAPTGCAGQYQGLQKYTYATKSWETLCPIMDQHAVTQNRKWHNAIYLKATDSILIYSGNQNDAQSLSSQTFTLQASAPYGSSSFDSMAPPAVQPILLPWDDSSSVMIGGDEANGRVMLFTTDGSPRWIDTGASLADPLPKRMRAALVRADDGSKTLYSFDLTTAPNVVNRIVLIDSSGNPLTKSPTIVPRGADPDLLEASIVARDLTLQNWPNYNSTLAPATVRSDSAAAQDSNGRVIFTGGSDADTMSIFNVRENSWEDAAATFEDQTPLRVNSASSSSKSSATSSSSASSSSSSSSSSSFTSISAATTGTTSGTIASTGAAATGTDSAADSQSTDTGADKAPTDPNVILGAAFGGLVGCALLLALFLLIARRCHAARRIQQSGRGQRDIRSPLPEKGEFSFNSNNHHTNNGSTHRFPSPPATAQSRNRAVSAASSSSAAILMGHADKSGDVARKPSQNSHRTSTSSLFNTEFKSTIGQPIPPALASPAPPYEAKAVSFGQTASPPRRPARPSEAIDPEDPARRSSGWNRYWSGGSILNSLSKDNKRDSEGAASSIYTDSPEYRMTKDSIALPSYFEGRPELNHVHSGSPTISLHPSVTVINEGMTGTIERPISTGSEYSSRRESAIDTWPSVPGPWFSDHNNTTRHSDHGDFQGHGLTVPGSRPVRPSQPGVSQQPQLPTAAQSSDMSWLNLGDQSSGPNHI